MSFSLPLLFFHLSISLSQQPSFLNLCRLTLLVKILTMFLYLSILSSLNVLFSLFFIRLSLSESPPTLSFLISAAITTWDNSDYSLPSLNLASLFVYQSLFPYISHTVSTSLSIHISQSFFLFFLARSFNFNLLKILCPNLFLPSCSHFSSFSF